MKKTILAAVFAIAGAAIAPAETLTAEIPFAFHVPGAQMPAGKYFIDRANTSSTTAYTFREADSTRSYYVAAPYLKSTGPHIKQSQLVFRCESENACQLEEIQSANAQLRVGVPASMKNITPVKGTEVAAMFIRVAAK